MRLRRRARVEVLVRGGVEAPPGSALGATAALLLRRLAPGLREPVGRRGPQRSQAGGEGLRCVGGGEAASGVSVGRRHIAHSLPPKPFGFPRGPLEGEIGGCHVCIVQRGPAAVAERVESTVLSFGHQSVARRGRAQRRRGFNTPSD